MGLKGIELQKYLGVDNATISRWEKGKQKIKPGHDRLLRVVYASFKGSSNATIASLVKELFAQIQSKELATAPYMIDFTKWSDGCLLPAT